MNGLEPAMGVFGRFQARWGVSITGRAAPSQKPLFAK